MVDTMGTMVTNLKIKLVVSLHLFLHALHVQTRFDSECSVFFVFVMAQLTHMFESASRGYHYYQNTWLPQVNQELLCVHQPENAFDIFAIALLVPADENVNVVIGHLPREISRASYFLMDRGAEFKAEVSSQRYRRSPLVQGGLEVPIRLYVSMRPTRLNEKILDRYISIYNELYEEPGAEHLREIIISSPGEGPVDFNMESLLPKEAGEKKTKLKAHKKEGPKSMDIRSLFAKKMEKETRKKDNSPITLD